MRHQLKTTCDARVDALHRTVIMKDPLLLGGNSVPVGQTPSRAARPHGPLAAPLVSLLGLLALAAFAPVCRAQSPVLPAEIEQVGAGIGRPAVQIPTLHSYVNSSNRSRFNLWRNGVVWKTVSWSNPDEPEEFGAVDGGEFYSYRNDAQAGRFHVFKNGMPHRVQAWCSPRQPEAFGTIENGDLYTHHNDAGTRRLQVFRNGAPWRTVPWPDGQRLSFGAVTNGELYTYSVDASLHRLTVLHNGTVLKIQAWRNPAEVEFFGAVAGGELFTLVSHARERRFLLIRNGEPFASIPWAPGTVQAFGSLR